MVLSFVPRTPAPNRSGHLAGQDASIVIFPGVRYERPVSADKPEALAAKKDGTPALPTH